MKKTIGELIDQLTITNMKIFYLVEKVQKNEHTREDAKKIQDLNSLRSQLTNAINEYFSEQPDIKVTESMGIELSFIAKPVFYRQGAKGGIYPVRISSRIRGQEIAEYLGAEYLNQDKPRYDKRIYLKPRSLKRIRDNDYVDILDGLDTVELLKNRPNIRVITMTPLQHEYLSKVLKNPLILIPHHHINIEKAKRQKNKVLTGGIIGKGTPQYYQMFEEIKAHLRKAGIEFKNCFEYQTRHDMIDFYKSIDFLLIWYLNNDRYRDLYFVNPCKIINAASFGIPTISPRLKGNHEFEGDYLVAENYDEIVGRARELQKNYEKRSTRLLARAEEYHISKIAELYKKL